MCLLFVYCPAKVVFVLDNEIMVAAVYAEEKSAKRNGCNSQR